MAVLWEGPRDDPRQAKARGDVVDTVQEILRQVELWKSAERLTQAMRAYTHDAASPSIQHDYPITTAT